MTWIVLWLLLRFQLAGYGQDLLHTPIISQYVNKYGKYKYGLQFSYDIEYMDEESLQQTVEAGVVLVKFSKRL